MLVIVSSMTNDFKKARRNLSVLYLCIIGSVIILFTLLVIYQANDSFSDPSVATSEDAQVTARQAKEIAERMTPDGIVESSEYEIEKGSLYFTTVFTDEREVKVNLLTGDVHTPSSNVGIVESLTDDFEERIVSIALFVFMLSSLLSLYVAQRTLRPIVESIRKQKQFVSDTAHELRNPLAALHARIESVSRTSTVSIETDVLQDLLAETKHLIVMSESLLALERNEEKSKQIAPQAVAPFIDSVLKRLYGERSEKQITLHTDIDSEPLLIDALDLETIFYNLLHNAFKFSLKDGAVTILWKDHTLTVSDTGIGIANEHIAHIFDRFYKADSSRSKEGNGLGLALVREICEKYNAKITATSTLGKGTKITIQFI